MALNLCKVIDIMSPHSEILSFGYTYETGRYSIVTNHPYNVSVRRFINDAHDIQHAYTAPLSKHNIFKRKGSAISLIINDCLQNIVILEIKFGFVRGSECLASQKSAKIVSQSSSQLIFKFPQSPV